MKDKTELPKRVTEDRRECEHEIFRDFLQIDDITFFGEYCPVCKAAWPINGGKYD